jgi:hypothetical protein
MMAWIYSNCVTLWYLAGSICFVVGSVLKLSGRSQ